MKLLTAALSVSLIAGCAAYQPPAKVADSRWPSAEFPLNRQATTDLIVSQLANSEETIESISSGMIQTRDVLDDRLTAMWSAINGCSYCDDPFIRYTYILTAIAAGTRVMVQYVKISPFPGGEEERSEMNSNEDFNWNQNRLWDWRKSFSQSASPVVYRYSTSDPTIHTSKE